MQQMQPMGMPMQSQPTFDMQSIHENSVSEHFENGGMNLGNHHEGVVLGDDMDDEGSIGNAEEPLGNEDTYNGEDNEPGIFPLSQNSTHVSEDSDNDP